MHPSGDPRRPKGYDTRFATLLVLVVTGAVLLLWLWSRLCEFPSLPWNDIRVATTVALAQGWTVYPTDAHGTINTWTYGPLPLLFFWPASWASSAGGALMVAGVLNLALTLVPLAVVCFGWPASDPASDRRGPRAIAFMLCLALWPERHYSVHLADNLAIACGLLGNLVLIRADTSGQKWLAALLAVSSVACKQTAIGIPLAQVIWLAMACGRTAALMHGLRCIVGGALIGALAVAAFGWAGLWFTLVELPAHFRWVSDVIERVMMARIELLFHVVVPLVLMIVRWRWFSRSSLLLPALTWICVLPLGLSALFKFGGRMNSVHSLVLWLPPVLTVFLLEGLPSARRPLQYLGAALVAATFTFGRVLETPRLFLRPQLSAYHDAQKLARLHRGQIWFPMHPLVTLYSEGRYYHDEDGWWVRTMTHKAIPPEQAAAHLPPAMSAMAFRNNWNDWGIARGMLPPHFHPIEVGDWILWVPGKDAAAR